MNLSSLVHGLKVGIYILLSMLIVLIPVFMVNPQLAELLGKFGLGAGVLNALFAIATKELQTLYPKGMPEVDTVVASTGITQQQFVDSVNMLTELYSEFKNMKVTEPSAALNVIEPQTSTTYP